MQLFNASHRVSLTTEYYIKVYNFLFLLQISLASFPDIEGFQIIPIKAEEEKQVFRVNIFNDEDFQQWKQAFCETTSSTYNVLKTLKESVKMKFIQHLGCQHGVPEREEYLTHKKLYTG